MAELNREELPQEKWKKERFEGQYIPNYEMSKGSKAYEKLHNIRTGMDTLPITLGGNWIGNTINGVSSVIGAFPSKYRAVPSSINPSDISMEDMFQWWHDLGNDAKNYQLVDILDGYDGSADDWYKEWQTTSDGEDYLKKHLKDRKINSVKENFKSNKRSMNQLNTVFKKALGVADIAGKAATSNLIGKTLNKLEDNWYEPSAKIIYKNVRKYLPDEGKIEIDEKGLTPSLWYKWVHPQIELIDEPKYKTFLTTDEIMDAYDNNEVLDYLPSRPDYWDSMDSKAKFKHIEGWKNLKNKSRRNLEMNIDEDILKNEED